MALARSPRSGDDGALRALPRGVQHFGIPRCADAHPCRAMALAAGGHQHVLRLRDLHRRSRRMRRSISCESRSGMSHGWILVLMGGLFLGLGYLGVPVAFSITAGVLVATMLTPISLPSIIGQLFNGVDSEALLAVPFFLLVGELM